MVKGFNAAWCSWLLVLLAAVAPAEELVLDSVTARDARGEVKLRANGRRATFDYDAGKQLLIGSGTWYATTMQPNYMARFTHKVEDMTASADGVFRMRSYECVEGMFGMEFLGASVCGGYGFGPNQLDEGGLVDDVVTGPPITLADYAISAFDWTGESLVIVLSRDSTEKRRLTLRFVRPRPDGPVRP